MINLVTDSTSNIPAALIKQLHISTVPMKVQFGRESYDEFTGLSPQDFVSKLAAAKIFPTTSQPASHEFLAAYQNILTNQPEAEILTITVSSKLSGTHNAAVAAARELSTAPITVFDSLSAALGAGVMVITAAELAAQGRSMADILARLSQMRQDLHLVLLVDSLEFLRRSGRLGAAAAWLGALLQTKPILTINQGQIEPLAQVRTKQKAMQRLVVELEARLVRPDQPVLAGVMHLAANADMARLVELMQARFNITRLFTAEFGPVIGTHLGPGALGVGLCPEAV